jgi:flagellar biosynthesis protein FliR
MQLQFNSATLVALLLCSIRITAWLVVCPPFANAGIPPTVRYMLGVALSLAVVPSASAHVPPPEIPAIMTSAVEQVVVGGALGFLTRLLFSAVESAGSLIDTLGGFSVAFSYDPQTQNTTSIFGKFYGLLMATLLFATNAHLVIIDGFLRSFQGIPLDGTIDMSRVGAASVSGISTMFVTALQIGGPLIAVYFVTDLALGVLSRISPQLNVFQISFPLKIMLTLGLAGLSFALLPQVVTELATDASRLIGGVTGAGGG